MNFLCSQPNECSGRVFWRSCCGLSRDPQMLKNCPQRE
uniref:Thymidylate synthase n=1 Tax=Mus musculus TaxID=10090 RepID=A0A0G2JGF0_MOUSE